MGPMRVGCSGWQYASWRERFYPKGLPQRRWLAALAADGTSTIRGAHHVQRGYENIEGKFLELGARIERLAEGNDTTSP